jgi:hypothetical protein
MTTNRSKRALRAPEFETTTSHRDGALTTLSGTRRRQGVGVVAVLAGLALSTLLLPGALDACSSCGCYLSSDWAAQGFVAGSGFRLDLRFDYFNQDQMRSGTGAADEADTSIPSDHEVQRNTINRNYTLVLDYSPSPEWGISVHVPFYDRYHTAFAEGDTEYSTSDFNRLGDLRIVGRYQGFSSNHSTGVQVGLKLATGAIHEEFIAGPEAGEPLDRGLQPGTGTTDLLVGVYHFGALGPRWNYFAQAFVQQPLSSRDDFKPGTGLNVNLGLRYLATAAVVPQVQLNLRAEKRESGANADVENSGATLAYLGPGLSIDVARGLQIYGFFQVPVYQNVNGLQIEPRYSASMGLHFQP